MLRMLQSIECRFKPTDGALAFFCLGTLNNLTLVINNAGASSILRHGRAPAAY